jgi:hypothetical protein
VTDHGTNRMIQRVSEDKNKLGEQLYVFHFPAILSVKERNKYFEVRLSRTDQSGKVMNYLLWITW